MFIVNVVVLKINETVHAKTYIYFILKLKSPKSLSLFKRNFTVILQQSKYKELVAIVLYSEYMQLQVSIMY